MSVAAKNNVTRAVFAEHIRSSLYYRQNNKIIRNALQDVSFHADCSKAYWVASSSVFEAKLFLEILANSKPYESGKCVLMDRGMMQKKQVILDHVFYVGSTNNLYKNMNVLEYLMFVTSHEKTAARTRQSAIFELLKKFGLLNISLTLIDILSPSQKLLVLMFVATMVKSRIVIVNLPRLSFDATQIESFSIMAERIKKQNKTLIFTSSEPLLVDAVADGVLYIKEGRSVFEGTREQFVTSYDRCLYSLCDDDNQALARELRRRFPTLEVLELPKESRVQIWDRKGIIKNEDDFYLALFRAGISPRIVERNIPNIKNALRGFNSNDL